MSTTSGQQLLLPESTYKKRKERRVIVAVNSRDRNYISYPNSNSFRWRFRRPLKDVVSLQLINGSIPSDLYTINVGWNRFTFQEAGTNYTVTLTPGRYTTAQFETELTSRLNGLSGITNTYTAVISTTTQQLTITRVAGAASFALLFKTGVYRDLYDATVGCLLEILSPAVLMGFGFNDYVDVAGVITSPNRYDIQALTNRLYLHINADNSQELNRIEFGGGRHDCFHIFYLDQATGGYTFLNKETDIPVYSSSPAPIARMATLDISIRDEFFRLMDLNNREICLLFEICYLDT